MTAHRNEFTLPTNYTSCYRTASYSQSGTCSLSEAIDTTEQNISKRKEKNIDYNHEGHVPSK